MTPDNNSKADLNQVIDGIEADIHGVVGLDSLDEAIQARAKEMLSGAKNIIIMGQELFPEVIRHLNSKGYRGELTLRDAYTSHTSMVSGRLNWQTYKAIKALHRAGYHGFPMADGPYDARFLKGAISYPHLAILAGLGYRGWHSFLITPEFGPRLRLAGVLTDAPLAATSHEHTVQSYCLKCGGACAKICPAGAIKIPAEGETHHIDQYACSTYLSATGPCAECVKACPTGQRI
jgi:epoxyqueuosine reductase